ncbi:hypothetical protein BVY03_03180 [bacterium K02(2017)]|nr:hypothetical protein BVY03_03180 [bacterium K02(2017)]
MRPQVSSGLPVGMSVGTTYAVPLDPKVQGFGTKHFIASSAVDNLQNGESVVAQTSGKIKIKKTVTPTKASLPASPIQARQPTAVRYAKRSNATSQNSAALGSKKFTFNIHNGYLLTNSGYPIEKRLPLGHNLKRILELSQIIENEASTLIEIKIAFGDLIRVIVQYPGLELKIPDISTAAPSDYINSVKELFKSMQKKVPDQNQRLMNQLMQIASSVSREGLIAPLHQEKLYNESLLPYVNKGMINIMGALKFAKSIATTMHQRVNATREIQRKFEDNSYNNYAVWGISFVLSLLPASATYGLGYLTLSNFDPAIGLLVSGLVLALDVVLASIYQVGYNRPRYEASTEALNEYLKLHRFYHAEHQMIFSLMQKLRKSK